MVYAIRFANALSYYIAAQDPNTSSKKCKKHVVFAKKSHKMIKQWVDLGNPNLDHWLKLCGRNEHLAVQYYTHAVALAASKNIIQDEALALERSASFFLHVRKNRQRTFFGLPVQSQEI